MHVSDLSRCQCLDGMTYQRDAIYPQHGFGTSEGQGTQTVAVTGSQDNTFINLFFKRYDASPSFHKISGLIMPWLAIPNL